MRLSEKGCVHLNEWMVHKLPMNAFVFKPEDFTDCVVLTVEEVKTLIDFFVTMKPEMPNGGCMEYCDLWRDFLQKRIERSEKDK